MIKIMRVGQMNDAAKGTAKLAVKIPTHEVTYTRLRDMILFGQLAPGQPVTIQGLIADLGAGMTPVREAIRRLAAEGALLPQGNRRVAVPRITLAELEQLAFARLTIEARLAELAALNVSDALISALMAADAEVDRSVIAGDIHGYLQSNHAFHFALYGAAGAGVLLGMAQSLWLRFGPSLRVVTQLTARASLPDAHKGILEGLRAGRGDLVAAALRADIGQGVGYVRDAVLAKDL